jgi:hypothetical protein
MIATITKNKDYAYNSFMYQLGSKVKIHKENSVYDKCEMYVNKHYKDYKGNRMYALCPLSSYYYGEPSFDVACDISNNSMLFHGFKEEELKLVKETL